MRHLPEKRGFLLAPSLHLLCFFVLSQLRDKDITTDNGNTGHPGRASTHTGLPVSLLGNLAAEGSWNKPNRRLSPWWTGNSLLAPVLFEDSSRPESETQVLLLLPPVGQILALIQALCYQVVYE
jgi:hypothetical protein